LQELVVAGIDVENRNWRIYSVPIATGDVERLNEYISEDEWAQVRAWDADGI
jgi:hypothetical protein